MLFDGLYIPLATPFYPDGRVYLRKLEHNVARYSLTPASGMIVLGPSSEAAGLTDREFAEVLQSAVAAAEPEKVLIAGITRDSVFATLQRAEIAAAAGYDAVLLTVPQSWAELAGSQTTPWDSQALLTFFRAVADRSPLPVLLGSSPSLPLAELPATVVGELARHANVQGIVDTACDEARLQALLAATSGITHTHEVTPTFQAVTARMHAAHRATQAQQKPSSTFVSAASLTAGGGTAVIVADPISAGTAAPIAPLKTRTRSTGFQIIAAGLVDAHLALAGGAHAVAPQLATAVPQASHEVVAAWKDGDPALAQEKQQRLVDAQARVHALGVPAVKYASGLSGYYGGPPRLPLLPLEAPQRQELDRLFNTMRS